MQCFWVPQLNSDIHCKAHELLMTFELSLPLGFSNLLNILTFCKSLRLHLQNVVLQVSSARSADTQIPLALHCWWGHCPFHQRGPPSNARWTLSSNIRVISSEEAARNRWVPLTLFLSRLLPEPAFPVMAFGPVLRGPFSVGKNTVAFSKAWHELSVSIQRTLSSRVLFQSTVLYWLVIGEIFKTWVVNYY